MNFLKYLPNPFRDLREAKQANAELLCMLDEARLATRALGETLDAEIARNSALSCELRVARRQLASRDAKIKTLTLRGQDTATWLGQVVEEVKTARRPDAEIIIFPGCNETVN